jgi:hypothetical protein
VPFLLSSRKNASPDPLLRLAAALVSQKLEHATVYTEYVVSLSDGVVVSTRSPEVGDHAPLDVDEMAEAEAVLLSDPEFCEVVRKLRLPEGAIVVADSWPV